MALVIQKGRVWKTMYDSIPLKMYVHISGRSSLTLGIVSSDGIMVGCKALLPSHFIHRSWFLYHLQ